jgi:tripartite-type tricarboxylate transporter receptor subunit TctC
VKRKNAMNKSRLLRVFATAVLFAACVASPDGSFAGSWPQQSVRIITGPLAAGSSIDATARVLAEELSKRWKQSVVVDTRPGADGIIAAKALLEARDGHTLLFTTHSIFTVVPLLREPIPYDPKADFAPISLGVHDFLAIVVAPSLPANSLPELVSYAKKRPGELNYYAVPGAPYLGYLAFQKGVAINTTFVPYTNHTNAISDLSEGRLQVAVLPLAAIVGLAKAGKVKLLAVLNDQRSPVAADVPTVAESGFPGFFSGGLLGMFGPKDMPAELRERIAAEMCDVLGRADVKERLANFGLIAHGTTPAEFAAILDTQRAKWTAVAREHDIKPQR